MPRIARWIVVAGFIVIFAGAHAAQAAHRQGPPIVTAKAAFLVDNQTGEVLWQRNPDLPLPPASTTKIVTAMLALQSGRLDDSLSVSANAAQMPPSKISLRPGWRMRLRDLVYAVLLNSANDASVVIAEGLSGSVPDFANRMNLQAHSLGATNSHFVNPNGLPAPNHYSTARDLATMFSHAMQNPMFETVINTKSTVVSPTAGSSRRILLHSHNRLLSNYRIHVVGKTGWTIAAKKCFVGAAYADGREIGVAVLGSRDLWGDLRRLLESGFSGTNPPQPETPELEMASATAATLDQGDDQADDGRRASNAQRYSVRLASFRQLNAAQRFKAQVTRSGYPARIERVRSGRHHRYLVSVGTYASREQAVRAAANLKRSQKSIKTLVVSSS